MFLSLCYVVLRRVLQLAAMRVRSNDLKELEIVVLRHELAILRRRTRCPATTWIDRLFLAAASRLLPRARWRSFIITPGTLLSTHRRRTEGTWHSGLGDHAAHVASSSGSRTGRHARWDDPGASSCEQTGEACSPPISSPSRRFGCNDCGCLLVLNDQHLERVLDVFVEHYNGHRPHRALVLTPPRPTRPPVAPATE